jgi:hypothetical protein
MTQHGPEAEHEIDALLHAQLQRKAQDINPQPLQERIFATLEQSAQPALLDRQRGPRFRRLRSALRSRWTWGLVAAAVVLAFLGGLQISPNRASAEALLREAQQVHRLPLDRCYLVEVRRESGWQSDMAAETPARVTRLWTRGDRFWIESVNPRQRWAWGRDDQNGVWMTGGLGRGIRLDADEVPPWLALLCDVHSLQLDTLLAELLRDFDVQREGHGPDTLPTTYVIRATPRPGPRPLFIRSVQLEVDAETKVLRRVVISRVRQGQPLATTTYSLVETATQPDARFRLEGHLREPFEVYTRDHRPERRAEILVRIYGPQAEKWFKSRPEKN